MKTDFEWDIEFENPETENIEDHDFASSLKDERFAKHLREITPNEHLVIVCDQWPNSGGLKRSWAYVKDGRLPVMFTDADNRDTIRVPKRFHAELEAFNKANPKPVTA